MSKPGDQAGGDPWVAVGVVLRPHGLDGMVRIKALTRTPEEFVDAPFESVRIRRRGVLGQILRFTHRAIHQDIILARFEGLDDRTAVEAIAGLELVIPESERWELPADNWYVDQLIGLSVVHEGVEIGRVEAVHDGPAHDFLVFRRGPAPGKETWIPLVRQIVTGVDLAARRVTIAPPPGLLE